MKTREYRVRDEEDSGRLQGIEQTRGMVGTREEFVDEVRTEREEKYCTEDGTRSNFLAQRIWSQDPDGGSESHSRSLEGEEQHHERQHHPTRNTNNKCIAHASNCGKIVNTREIQ